MYALIKHFPPWAGTPTALLTPHPEMTSCPPHAQNHYCASWVWRRSNAAVPQPGTVGHDAASTASPTPLMPIQGCQWHCAETSTFFWPNNVTYDCALSQTISPSSSEYLTLKGAGSHQVLPIPYLEMLGTESVETQPCIFRMLSMYHWARIPPLPFLLPLRCHLLGLPSIIFLACLFYCLHGHSKTPGFWSKDTPFQCTE